MAEPEPGRDAAAERSDDDGAAPDKHPVDPASERLGYEVADARAGTLGWVMGIAVAIIAGSLAGLFALIGLFHHAGASTPALTPQQDATIAPPGPPLQDDPFRDVAALRKREDERLDGFGYLGPDHARAHIPLDRASALVIGKPLDPAP